MRLVEVRAQLARLSEGVHTIDDRWWVRAGEHGWTVRMVPGLLSETRPDWAALGWRHFVITDSHVWKLYGDAVSAYLDAHGVEYHVIALPAERASNTFRALGKVGREMRRFGVRGDDVTVGLGGAAIADLARAAAAWKSPATACVCVPTSLFGALDGALRARFSLDDTVDGTTHRDAWVGHRPATVTIIDPGFFGTLSSVHTRSGVAEALRLGLMRDSALVNALDKTGRRLIENGTWHTALGANVLERAVKGKLHELQRTPPDLNPPRPDFGRFLGRSLEATGRPRLSQGHSVSICLALGMVVAAERGSISWLEFGLRLMRQKLRLPVWHPALRRDLLSHAMGEGGTGAIWFPQKVGGQLRLLEDVTVDELLRAADYLSRVR